MAPSPLGQKKYAKAEPLLLSGYEGLKAREARIPVPAKIRLTEAIDRLVQLYEAWGKPEQAAQWREKRCAFQVADEVQFLTVAHLATRHASSKRQCAGRFFRRIFA